MVPFIYLSSTFILQLAYAEKLDSLLLDLSGARRHSGCVEDILQSSIDFYRCKRDALYRDWADNLDSSLFP